MVVSIMRVVLPKNKYGTCMSNSLKTYLPKTTQMPLISMTSYPKTKQNKTKLSIDVPEKHSTQLLFVIIIFFCRCKAPWQFTVTYVPVKYVFNNFDFYRVIEDEGAVRFKNRYRYCEAQVQF